MLSRSILILAGVMGLIVVGCGGRAQPESAATQTPAAHAPLAGDPALDAAIELVAQGKYAQAQQNLELLAGGYETANEPRHASEAFFWLGFCKEKIGSKPEATKLYRLLMDKYPQTEAARMAVARLDAMVAP